MQFIKWLFTLIKYIMTFAVWKCCLYIYIRLCHCVVVWCIQVLYGSFPFLSLSNSNSQFIFYCCWKYNRLILMQKMNMVWVNVFLSVFITLFDHYYFTTDGSLCLLYSIHSNVTITMSMVWLNFDLFHKMLSSSNQCNQSIIIVLNSLLIVLPERAP